MFRSCLALAALSVPSARADLAPSPASDPVTMTVVVLLAAAALAALYWRRRK
jgi:hypothetical protein